MSDIMEFSQFDQLSNKKKKEVMLEWRNTHTNSVIRKALGINNSQFYKILSELNLPRKQRIKADESLSSGNNLPVSPSGDSDSLSSTRKLSFSSDSNYEESTGVEEPTSKTFGNKDASKEMESWHRMGAEAKEIVSDLQEAYIQDKDISPSQSKALIPVVIPEIEIYSGDNIPYDIGILDIKKKDVEIDKLVVCNDGNYLKYAWDIVAIGSHRDVKVVLGVHKVVLVSYK